MQLSKDRTGYQLGLGRMHAVELCLEELFTSSSTYGFGNTGPLYIETEQALLPIHLPRRPEHDSADAEFFCLHLRCTLCFMLLGGDVSETYPPGRVLSIMEELGVSGDDDEEMVPLSDDTELGKAILAAELQGPGLRNLEYGRFGRVLRGFFLGFRGRC
ncbi:hypothetical protein DFH09DRAFT_1103335 [Mycena vulgaris]|nr:hypothetical protein DFH09DRAFT_1103335 [Mycena vulgaris]